MCFKRIESTNLNEALYEFNKKEKKIKLIHIVWLGANEIPC